MARTIAVCTQKGGVGKTTTVANLAAAWGSQDRRVLAVDFDPQFALTRRFGIDPSERPTIADVLEGMILKSKTAADAGRSSLARPRRSSTSSLPTDAWRMSRRRLCGRSSAKRSSGALFVDTPIPTTSS